jgi:hypothetical protein
MTESPPTAAGPATRAVLEQYHHTLARHRRRVITDRVILGVLVLWTLAGFVLSVASLGGPPVPLALRVSPIPLLILWLVLKDRIATALGSPGVPQFPQHMLEIAAQQDAAAANPRPFGSVPPSMRVYHPEHW